MKYFCKPMFVGNFVHYERSNSYATIIVNTNTDEENHVVQRSILTCVHTASPSQPTAYTHLVYTQQPQFTKEK
jgi:hypothetical protein